MNESANARESAATETKLEKAFQATPSPIILLHRETDGTVTLGMKGKVLDLGQLLFEFFLSNPEFEPLVIVPLLRRRIQAQQTSNSIAPLMN